MSHEIQQRLAALREAWQQCAVGYGLSPADAGDPAARAEADASAAALGDGDYLQARVRLLEAELDAATLHLTWLAPGHVPAPREAMARIKALCQYVADPYDLLLAVQATHPGVSRDILARALKSCRPDLAALNPEDLTGLLTAAWTGGRHGYDAVRRTRRTAERKAASLPWVEPT